MANYNRVILAGNLTRDPQLTYLPSQTAVVDFGLAINRYWTGQDGQKREETCFIDLRAFGKQAETLNHYMTKGNSILVEGRLKFEQWTGQDGKKHSRHRVIVDSFQFLGGRNDQSSGGAPAPAAKPPVQQRQTPPAAPPEPEDFSQAPPSEGDIPF